MKFYENSELVATLNNDEAIEHCLRCPYCYTTQMDHTRVWVFRIILEPGRTRKPEIDDNQLRMLDVLTFFFPDSVLSKWKLIYQHEHRIL